MLCQTIKQDKECYFWSKEGCVHEDGQCHQIIDKCEGCSRTEEWPTGKFCTNYGAPANQWTVSVCNMATNIKAETAEAQKMVNPLKASKRMGRG